jgi:hypothetical protein
LKEKRGRENDKSFYIRDRHSIDIKEIDEKIAKEGEVIAIRIFENSSVEFRLFSKWYRKCYGVRSPETELNPYNLEVFNRRGNHRIYTATSLYRWYNQLSEFLRDNIKKDLQILENCFHHGIMTYFLKYKIDYHENISLSGIKILPELLQKYY